MRIRALLGLVLVGCLGLGLALWMATPRHRITRAGFEGIRDAVTFQEVETIMAVPPGNYSNGDPQWFDGGNEVLPVHLLEGFGRLDDSDAVWRVWISEEAAILVRVEPDGKVVGRAFFGVVPARETLIVKCRRWLGF